jgi:transcriptional regulator of acetoin/glycerol metabolism
LRLHPRLIEVLVTRRWPGNVRELIHEIRDAAQAARAAGSSDVRPEHLAPDAGQRLKDAPPDSGSGPAARSAKGEVGKDELLAAIESAGGNLSAAARALGLHRTQLYRMMDKHGIARGGKGEDENEE